MGLIRRKYINLDENIFLKVFKVLVRSHIEYAKTKYNLEPNQNERYHCNREWTKKSNKIFTTTEAYERLKKLNLPTLCYRRMRGDMIETYKLWTGKYNRTVAQFMSQQQHNSTSVLTQGHGLKLYRKEQKGIETKFLHHPNSQPIEWITTRSHWSCHPYSFWKEIRSHPKGAWMEVWL